MFINSTKKAFIKPPIWSSPLMQQTTHLSLKKQRLFIVTKDTLVFLPPTLLYPTPLRQLQQQLPHIHVHTDGYNFNNCLTYTCPSCVTISSSYPIHTQQVCYYLFNFKFYSHNCYIYITIQTIQIHIAATNYMSMFYLFFGIEKKSFVRKKYF